MVQNKPLSQYVSPVTLFISHTFRIQSLGLRGVNRLYWCSCWLLVELGFKKKIPGSFKNDRVKQTLNLLRMSHHNDVILFFLKDIL